MITPKDLQHIEKENNDLLKIEEEIDNSIKKFHGQYPWEEAIIEGEHSVFIRNIIAKKYKDAGWNFVYHRTTSENGERAGLTCFKFSTTELDEKYIKNYHKV